MPVAPSPMFNKILVANRGEIALRVVRACRELDVPSVVAFSEADRDTLAVREADEGVCIGPAPPAKSYLHIPAIMSAALISVTRIFSRVTSMPSEAAAVSSSLIASSAERPMLRSSRSHTQSPKPQARRAM